MSHVNSYRDLRVWQDAVEFADRIYEATDRFSNDERFGLSSQLRRAATSVPSNVAEGHALAQTGEYLRHLSIAMGSLAEIETQLIIAHRRSYLTAENLDMLLDTSSQLGRMLRRLRQSLQKT